TPPCALPPPYTTLFRSPPPSWYSATVASSSRTSASTWGRPAHGAPNAVKVRRSVATRSHHCSTSATTGCRPFSSLRHSTNSGPRSEEHTSELHSRFDLV